MKLAEFKLIVQSVAAMVARSVAWSAPPQPAEFEVIKQSVVVTKEPSRA